MKAKTPGGANPHPQTPGDDALARKPPWRNEGEGPRPGARGGIPRPLQSAEGAPPARLARPAGEVEHERTR